MKSEEQSRSQSKDLKTTRKRNRVPVSCRVCRKRKVKCDKQQPHCLNCIKNNVQHLCVYAKPDWAKDSPPPEATIDNDPKPVTVKQEDTNERLELAHSLQKELDEMKLKVKALESENNELKKKMVNIPTVNEVTSTTSSLLVKPRDTDDLLDSIFNSNILFLAQQGNHYNIHITYQISVFSWMFIIKSDIYLNDLWMKILKLRQHYEYYYHKGTMEKNMISQYRNFKMKSLSPQIIPKEKTNEHTSKLKNFLEKSLNIKRATNHRVQSPTTLKNDITGEIEVSTPSSMLLQKQPQHPNKCPVTGVVGVCPIGENIMNSPLKSSNGQNHNAEDTAFDPKTQENKLNDCGRPKKQTTHQHPHLTHRSHHPDIKKCPVFYPVTGNPTVNSKSGTPTNDDQSDMDDMLEDNKVCPLIAGDGKALFKEKLTKMNISAIRESYSKSPMSSMDSPTLINQKRRSGSLSPSKSKSMPMIPSGPSTPLSDIKPQDSEKLQNYVPIAMKPESSPTSRQNSLKRMASSEYPYGGKMKKLKAISPAFIKSLNYNNTKQIINVIEQHLPPKKIVLLLIDRFFDKIYIHMPYVDETSFRHRVNLIIKASDLNSQRIKLSSIGNQYCEEFLTLCLMLIILRLSWLSLPDKSREGLNSNELLLMKPENFISLVLVEMVKEIFSNAKILTKPSAIIFQVGLYLRIYSTLSPEDGFDTDNSYTSNANFNNPQQTDPNSRSNSTSMSSSSVNSNDLSGDLTNESPNMNSPVYISMLVQLARTIGLNRDPLNFKNFYPKPNDDEATVARLFRKRHLWRKLWFGLLFVTIEANLSLGDYKKGLPIELDLDPTLGTSVNKTWDCRLPGGIEQGVLENSFKGGKILQRELCVVQSFRESIISYKWIYRGMKLLFNVDEPPSTTELEKIISKLSEIICEKSKYGYGIDLIMGNQEIVNPFRARNSSVWIKKYTNQIKILRLKVHLIIKNMIFTLTYLLFLNHEQKLSKLLGQKHASVEKIEKQRIYIETFFESSLLSAIESFKLFIQFMDEHENAFTNCSTGLLIYPFLLILNHRSHEFLISLILRIQQNSPIIMEVLKKNKIDPKELQKRLFTYVETFIERLDLLTKRYYYAWVLRRLVKFFHNILTNSQKLFKLNFKKMNVSDTGKATSELKSDTLPSKVHKNEETNHSNNCDGSTTSNNGKSAFEIAFGTSKLPPVTDFTHDDRREINFNPLISNSDILFNQQQQQQQQRHNHYNLQQGHQQHQPLTNNQPGLSDKGNNNDSKIPQTGSNNLTNVLFQNMEADLNFNANMKNTQTTPTIGYDDVNTVPMVSSNSDSSVHMNAELPAIFDDQFLNDIGSFGLDGMNIPGLMGLQRGLSSDGLTPPASALGLNVGNTPDTIIESSALNNEATSMHMGGGFYNAMMGQTGNINSVDNRVNSNVMGRPEMYNPLNEIDFTNIDLNTPVDNLMYGFEMPIPDSGNTRTEGGGENASNAQGSNNLTSSSMWNFF